jgi:hypothetical protein
MRSFLLVLIAFLNLLGPVAEAQRRSLQELMRRKPSVVKQLQPRATQRAEVKRLFGTIEEDIVKSALPLSSVPFADQVFVNMSSGESGYFSANQTVTILQRYLSARSSLSFEFSRLNDTGSTPYATGRLSFISRGRKESAQVYVSLRFQESGWVISQFNIY